MIRRRSSTAFYTKKGDEEVIEGPILVKIILKLPIKGIFVCKCVCKTWCNLISNPQFAKLHFALAKPYPLVRALGSNRVSRILYLVELPESEINDWYYERKPCVNMKLDNKLKIPLRNAELVFDSELDNVQKGLLPKGVGLKRKRCIKLKPKDHKFKIVNSCDGFICLSEPTRNDPVVVCNPVTGEFINLPVVKNVDENTGCLVDSGFGFCTLSNQYKVIRMFTQGNAQWARCPITGEGKYHTRVAEIHTLGTGSWKRIGHTPISSYKLAFTTYLNGALHWLFLGFVSPNCSILIVSFDFSNEQFQSTPPPPIDHNSLCLPNKRNMCLGVLKSCLCVCDAANFYPIDIWVMKVYGVRESWTKEICIQTMCADLSWPYGLYQPLDILSNGALLMFHYPNSALIYYDPKSPGFKYFKISGIRSKFEAIAHIPSFISLKDAVMGDNVVVHNIKSRCAELKLLGETKAPLLVEEDRACPSDSEFSRTDSEIMHPYDDEMMRSIYLPEKKKRNDGSDFGQRADSPIPRIT